MLISILENPPVSHLVGSLQYAAPLDGLISGVPKQKFWGGGSPKQKYSVFVLPQEAGLVGQKFMKIGWPMQHRNKGQPSIGKLLDGLSWLIP